ncbi:hypothetical protein [Pseudomonas sp. NPDC086278]|uniref:hypothetical protein n=1 Tax=Pseudomonas sp. NPDC086278 TaxID=3390646 RepID=UPI003CFE18F0
MNALEAMGAVELAERQLQISAVLNDEGGVLVSGSDAGGLAAEHIEQVLGAFVRGPGPRSRWSCCQ